MGKHFCLLLPIAFYLSACFSQEITELGAIDRGRIYIIGRIRFENFKVEQASLPEGRETCYVMFAGTSDRYVALGQGEPESVVRTGWNRHFMHSLGRDADGTGVYHLKSVYLALQEDAVPVPFYAIEQFELLIDLRFDYDAADACLYVGDLVFTLKGNDMFVAVEDRFDEAVGFFQSVAREDLDRSVSLEKRLLHGPNFVELRKTTSNGNTMTYWPTF